MRVRETLNSPGLDKSSLRDSRWCFEPNLPASIISEATVALAKVKATIVDRIEDAQYFLCSDPTNVGCRLAWASVLKGGWLVSPGCILGDRGALIKFKPATATKRWVYFSPGFLENHKTVTSFIQNLAVGKSHWKRINDVDEFKIEFDKAKRQKRPASVIYLKTSGEDLEAGFPTNSRVHSVTSFLESLRVIDNARTSTGTAK